MRTPDYGHQSIKACAAYEDMMAVRTEMFHQDVDFQIGIEKMHVATQPEKWVCDWVADPNQELADLYKQIALNYNDPQLIGQIVKQMFENKLRHVAEYIVGQQQ